MAIKTKSSRQWLKEHFTDPYVKQAHKDGLRSRAFFKLQEIQQKDRLFLPNMTIVDLGAAPGGWSQYLAGLLREKSRLIALDILPMEPLPHVNFIQGDFSEEAVLDRLHDVLGEHRVDWVLSDMAPNISGLKMVDLPRAYYLAELTVDFALRVLHPEGGFLIKVFQGEGFDQYLSFLRSKFKKICIRKPNASRDRSRELYLLARHLKV